MLTTDLAKELELVRSTEAFSEKEMTQIVQWGFEASFVPTEPGKNLYL